MDADYTILIHATFITVAILIIIIQFTYFSVNVDSLEKNIQALVGRIKSLEQEMYGQSEELEELEETPKEE
jgi:cell division protein FtsL